MNNNNNNDIKKILQNPTDLINLVKYQNDSIVSKTLIDKSTGSVTLFAFTKGQKLSEHTAPFDALVYILDGKAELSIGSQSHITEKNQILLFPANIPHKVVAIDNFKMLLIMIKE